MWVDDSSDSEFLSRWGLIFIVLLAISLLWLIEAEASEVEESCIGLPTFIEVDVDMTAPMLESYSNVSSQRRAELESLFDHDFDRSSYNGFYNWAGTWVVLNKIESGQYRVWSGQDWTIGEDGQVHSPTCYALVSDDYETYFGKFEKLWYPYRCNYEQVWEQKPYGDC